MKSINFRYRLPSTKYVIAPEIIMVNNQEPIKYVRLFCLFRKVLGGGLVVVCSAVDM